MNSGRIIKGVGGLYFVDTGEKLYECQARGLFRKHRESPYVGDFVEFSIVDEKKNAGYLQKILPRKNELFRPRVTNVDVVVIVFSIVSPAISTALLDRFVVLVEKQGLDIILCFNKSDLADGRGISGIAEIYEKIGYEVVLSSASRETGIEELTRLLSGKVAVFAGPSGVGKSSIVNIISPDALMETGEISRKIERGRHTTRHAEFIRLKNGGYVVDTPGFASVTTEDIPIKDFKLYFREFWEYNGKCRYRDCMHDTEPGCIVKELVGSVISEARYKSYIDMIHRGEIDD